MLGLGYLECHYVVLHSRPSAICQGLFARCVAQDDRAAYPVPQSRLQRGWSTADVTSGALFSRPESRAALPPSVVNSKYRYTPGGFWSVDLARAAGTGSHGLPPALHSPPTTYPQRGWPSSSHSRPASRYPTCRARPRNSRSWADARVCHQRPNTDPSAMKTIATKERNNGKLRGGAVATDDALACVG